MVTFFKRTNRNFVFNFKIRKMRLFISILLTTICISSHSQTNINTPEQKGLIFGLGAGSGLLNLKTNSTTTTALSATLPNIKIGYRINHRLAILALLPGATYKYNGKDRGFEAFQLAGQYWLQKKWWILGGVGLTFDAPVFYTVKDPKTAGFYTGIPAFSIGTGIEIWQKDNFSIDLQYRFFIGKSALPNNGLREGIANMLLVGFNWN